MTGCWGSISCQSTLDMSAPCFLEHCACWLTVVADLQVYVYNKHLAKPVAKKIFSQPPPPGPQDYPPFISSVCWKPDASMLLAANSEGTIKIFKLTS